MALDTALDIIRRRYRYMPCSSGVHCWPSRAVTVSDDIPGPSVTPYPLRLVGGGGGLAGGGSSESSLHTVNL